MRDPTRSPATASRLAHVVLALLLTVVAPAAVIADGCYIPAQAVRKIPNIPFQRALITWTGGVETLVVSSALDSESQRIGWIKEAVARDVVNRRRHIAVLPRLLRDDSLAEEGGGLARAVDHRDFAVAHLLGRDEEAAGREALHQPLHFKKAHGLEAGEPTRLKARRERLHRQQPPAVVVLLAGDHVLQVSDQILVNQHLLVLAAVHASVSPARADILTRPNEL